MMVQKGYFENTSNLQQPIIDCQWKLEEVAELNAALVEGTLSPGLLAPRVSYKEKASIGAREAYVVQSRYCFE